MSRVCVKVKNLRKLGYSSFREWREEKNNLYVGRRGRIFIDKKIYHYPGSKWANPYKVKEYGLKESLSLYLYYIQNKLNNGELDLSELVGMNLGCFCETNQCHAQVLLDLIKNGDIKINK